ncbi:hypothetical protein [Acidibrevibacterium fodinaquatile]|uniref:hypothetical protein n=1 Tax=Acidibrevibacterium fodinaquatile TaxID=1969806 RepID=UPI000E0DEC67|nr:hypothetical protein [Acidibrevibacterium fodinaquatile]
MIAVSPGVRVLLVTRPVDFRKGAHGLAALAAEVLDRGFAHDEAFLLADYAAQSFGVFQEPPAGSFTPAKP